MGGSETARTSERRNHSDHRRNELTCPHNEGTIKSFVLLQYEIKLSDAGSASPSIYSVLRGESRIYQVRWLRNEPSHPRLATAADTDEAEKRRV